MPLSQVLPTKLSHEKCGPLDYLWTPPTIKEDLANGRHTLDCHSSFCFGFGFFGCDPLQFPGTNSSLRSWTRLVEDKSCNVDVEDELLPGVADNPGTTRGTKLSVSQNIVFPSLFKSGFWPLTHSQEYPWSSQSFLKDRTAGVSSSNCTVTKRSRSWTYTCASSFVCNSPLAVTPTVGFLDLSKVSSSPELKPFFCSACALICSWLDHELSLFWRFWSGRQHCPVFIRSF